MYYDNPIPIGIRFGDKCHKAILILNLIVLYFAVILFEVYTLHWTFYTG